MSSLEIKFSESANSKLSQVNALMAGLSAFGGNGSAAFHAVYASVQRAARKGETEAGKIAAEHYYITKSQFMSKAEHNVTMSGNHGGVAAVTIKFAGNVIPLIEFSARYSDEGTFAVVRKDRSGQVLENAFITRSARVNVAERVGRSRLPLAKLYGPSAAHMMQNDQVDEKMAEVITETFEKRMDHEMTRIMNGW